MADKTASSSDASVQEKLISYMMKTHKGSILAKEVVLGLIVLICYAASRHGTWIGVPISGVIFSAVFLGVFAMELDKRFRWFHWVWSDFFRAAVDSALYLITCVIMVSNNYNDSAYRDTVERIGCVFGLIAGVLYAYDTYTIVLQLWSSSQQNPVYNALQLKSSSQQNPVYTLNAEHTLEE